jgi:hypothetical protein
LLPPVHGNTGDGFSLGLHISLLSLRFYDFLCPFSLVVLEDGCGFVYFPTWLSDSVTQRPLMIFDATGFSRLARMIFGTGWV